MENCFIFVDSSVKQCVSNLRYELNGAKTKNKFLKNSLDNIFHALALNNKL